MRSLLGPALGVLFYTLFREYLSIYTQHWLLFFGLLFVGFVVFSPTGLVGVWRRITAPMRPRVVEAIGRFSGRGQYPGPVNTQAFGRRYQPELDSVPIEPGQALQMTES